jgi:hypothetical protein
VSINLQVKDAYLKRNTNEPRRDFIVLLSNNGECFHLRK